ncbi:quinone-dependent dihydroorotate dehydrogenase [Commensalibacter papalotli (ex Servin-Garciduenas et al. 2014)]|uniref:Dihydroorotate dehydrogenase (quinone) n=1 Tax=Commensalibacter papalotli (ex Servin-Garciduenas et al. 2014) TaxID=1208583 RepID=W7E0D7_9PROT|nr:quinone-dependent dihydroorotate dehydrogenase [Commensalibacter papalotli (ex Servin-Garciduenas et al. 2014)]EUK18419.1 dihydroorotate dehydrogenase 2 [Commensalibacter papalotli (ex Servin-Garciduenas et al. 2014)]
MKSKIGDRVSKLEQEVISFCYPWIFKGFRCFSPETGHNLAISSLLLGFCGGRKPWQDDPRLKINAMGLSFPNPIGLAAGFDKNAMVISPLSRLGFGAVEVGTVTPRPQEGNPKPRLFRLIEDGAIINRMGFNNDGINRVIGRLARIRNIHGPFKTKVHIPVGVNIGINKIGANPEKDYPYLVGMVSHYADYIVLNLSSPNTPGLRDLQHPSRLRKILAAIKDQHPAHPPLLVKLAPDLEEKEVEAIVETAIDAGITGLILTNTTISRPDDLQGDFRYEPGGLSGRPIRKKSTEMLARVARLSKGRLTLIGCGGIETGADVIEKIMYGADFTQVYSALIYKGPSLVQNMKQEIIEILSRENIQNISELKGVAL